MRRIRKEYAVISFPATAHAFRLEACAHRAGLAGRLIPAPRELTAGCGLAWRDAPENENALRALLAREGIAYQTICVLTL